MMKQYRFTIKPSSALGTPMKGDTLFGQLCWAIANRFGADKLNTCLQGYAQDKPFLVVSDALPAGYLPMPTIPSTFFTASQNTDPTERKKMKKRQWLCNNDINKPLASWMDDGMACTNPFKQKTETQAHNSINRLTGTTGTGDFAPYGQPQLWLENGTTYAIYLLLDETRLSLADFTQALQDISLIGFGRDASIGLGKFDMVGDASDWDIPTVESANAWLTLAPCAPQGQPQGAWQQERCYYKPFTRFGRHGDVAATGVNPFKKPILLADTAALLMPVNQSLVVIQGFCGQGLTGMSSAMSETVHQGYAPVVPVCLPIGVDAEQKNEECAA